MAQYGTTPLLRNLKKDTYDTIRKFSYHPIIFLNIIFLKILKNDIVDFGNSNNQNEEYGEENDDETRLITGVISFIFIFVFNFY